MLSLARRFPRCYSYGTIVLSALGKERVNAGIDGHSVQICDFAMQRSFFILFCSPSSCPGNMIVLPVIPQTQCTIWSAYRRFRISGGQSLTHRIDGSERNAGIQIACSVRRSVSGVILRILMSFCTSRSVIVDCQYARAPQNDGSDYASSGYPNLISLCSVRSNWSGSVRI